MYHKKDYLLRLIEEFAQVLARLIGLRREGKYEEALSLIDRAYESYFPLSSKVLDDCPEEELVSLLAVDYRFEHQQLSALADLLRQEGEIWYEKDFLAPALTKLKKALRLYQYLDEEQKTIFSFERKNKINSSRLLILQIEDEIRL